MPHDQMTRAEIEDPVRADRRRRYREAIALLESWASEGDEQEQRESLAELMRLIDEDRPGQRKHFP